MDKTSMADAKDGFFDELIPISYSKDDFLDGVLGSIAGLHAYVQDTDILPARAGRCDSNGRPS